MTLVGDGFTSLYEILDGLTTAVLDGLVNFLYEMA